jgi:hypothetical protein
VITESLLPEGDDGSRAKTFKFSGLACDVRHPTWTTIDLISFRGQKPVQNPLHTTIVIDNQGPIFCADRSSDIGVFAVIARLMSAALHCIGVLTLCALLLDLLVE